MTHHILLLVGLVHLQRLVADDPSSLQGFCVATSDGGVFVNGMPCKDPKTVNEADFFFSGLDKMGNSSNVFGSKVRPVTITQIPGLNTLGISMARVDYAPFGLNSLHTHPRGTDIMYVARSVT